MTCSDQLYQQTVDVRDGLKRVIEMLDVSGDWVEKVKNEKAVQLKQHLIT